MSAPKTYTAYVRRVTERGEAPLTREEWNRRKMARQKRAELELSELQKLADAGDSQAIAELEERGHA